MNADNLHNASISVTSILLSISLNVVNRISDIDAIILVPMLHLMQMAGVGVAVVSGLMVISPKFKEFIHKKTNK